MTSDACTEAFQRLTSMVQDAERPVPERTEADEDRMAMEIMALELEGPDALDRYQDAWATWGMPR